MKHNFKKDKSPESKLEINYMKIGDTIEKSLNNCNLIDYEQITQAIVNAIRQVQNENRIEESNHSSKRIEFMKVINMLISIMMSIIAIALMYCIHEQYNGYEWKAWQWLDCVGVGAAFFILCLMIIGGVWGLIESNKDNPQETMLHYNSNLALIALILSLVSIFIIK